VMAVWRVAAAGGSGGTPSSGDLPTTSQPPMLPWLLHGLGTLGRLEGAAGAGGAALAGASCWGGGRNRAGPATSAAASCRAAAAGHGAASPESGLAAMPSSACRAASSASCTAAAGREAASWVVGCRAPGRAGALGRAAAMRACAVLLLAWWLGKRWCTHQLRLGALAEIVQQQVAALLPQLICRAWQGGVAGRRGREAEQMWGRADVGARRTSSQSAPHLPARPGARLPARPPCPWPPGPCRALCGWEGGGRGAVGAGYGADEAALVQHACAPPAGLQARAGTLQRPQAAAPAASPPALNMSRSGPFSTRAISSASASSGASGRPVERRAWV
jgi:hypothetical protein